MITAAVETRAPIEPLTAEHRRGRRVAFLLAMVVVLSLGDLAATTTHLQTIGMIEANPIAAFIIETTGSTWSLAAFKALSVTVCVMLLYRVRRRVQGEVAAWFSLCVLIALALYWGVYTEQIIIAEQLLASHPDAKPDRWMILAGQTD